MWIELLTYFGFKDTGSFLTSMIALIVTPALALYVLQRQTKLHKAQLATQLEIAKDIHGRYQQWHDGIRGEFADFLTAATTLYLAPKPPDLGPNTAFHLAEHLPIKEKRDALLLICLEAKFKIELRLSAVDDEEGSDPHASFKKAIGELHFAAIYGQTPPKPPNAPEFGLTLLYVQGAMRQFLIEDWQFVETGVRRYKAKS